MGQTISIQKETFDRCIDDLKSANLILSQTCTQTEKLIKNINNTINIKRQKIILLEQIINDIIEHKTKNLKLPKKKTGKRHFTKFTT
jgi:hypothetical protein